MNPDTNYNSQVTPDQTPSGNQFNDSPGKNPFKRLIKNKRLVVVVLVLVIAGLATTVWAVNRSSGPADQFPPEALEVEPERTFEIEITEDGFKPSSAVIAKGTKVVWINKTNQPHRIASNPHPEHDELPGLDSGDTPLGPGGEYEYTFEDTGSFGYHDDTDPTVNGTVEVAE